MMGILAQSKKGIVEQKPFIVLYGEEKIGKTSFLDGAPNPYCIDVEEGSGALKNITRSPKIEKYEDIWPILDELENEKHNFKTFGIDGLDTLQDLLFQKLCRDSGTNSIVKACEGYGNAYKVANMEWIKLIEKIKLIRKKRDMYVMGIGHAIAYSYNDPTTPSGYDRFTLKLHESPKVSAIKTWMDAADCILFAKKKVLQSDKQGEARRAVDSGEHVIYTQKRPAFDAGNRYDLPFELPLSWTAFEEALKRGPRNANDLRKEANDYIEQLKDEEICIKAKSNVIEVGDNIQDLENIVERLKTILSEQRG